MVDENTVIARRARASLGCAIAEVVAPWDEEGRPANSNPGRRAPFWLEVVDRLADPTPKRKERELLEFMALVEEFEAD